ncbi:transcriptional regulator [Sinomonas cellulolyticus]|uniref:TetR family transcriptional regulator n=1 Tax=Sinomonas cellulolyticus TaxID=2801916 RepID=A0ABS1K647_9MICC|nr:MULTISPECIES: TetR/AcrR family transcriptional regulator [Sinomonas]MBL0706948.1 TetR family transcriptional regulator [Sinomonas cellulolyticus]GHG59894.1 transcriptional regulator [Sinomonas sp. KCTC 49339]
MVARPSAQRRPRAKSERERSRQPTEVRRRLVIESARDLIADKGLFNVQIRDISKVCEVSPGTITYHFRSLEELLFEVVQAETREFYEPLRTSARTAGEDSGTAAIELQAIVGGLFLDDLKTRRHWLIWIDFWSAAARDETYGRWMSTHYDSWRRTLQEIIERGVQQGEFSCDQPIALARDIASLVDGLAVQCYSLHSSITVDAAREAITRYVAQRLGLGLDASTSADRPT